MSGSECSAPFLTNPFVNMGMYVAYYWTTLVAMLILYKVSIRITRIGTDMLALWDYASPLNICKGPTYKYLQGGLRVNFSV